MQINDTICLFERDGMRLYMWSDGEMLPIDYVVKHPYDLSDPQLKNASVVEFAMRHVEEARHAAASRMLRLRVGKYSVSTLAMAAAVSVRERCNELAHCFIKCDDQLEISVRSVNGTSMMSNITHDIYSRETFRFLNKAVRTVARPRR
ncbi:MAG: hypothetical protein ACXVAC_08740 [Vulcanimicrobiaceae bacterium]